MFEASKVLRESGIDLAQVLTLVVSLAVSLFALWGSLRNNRRTIEASDASETRRHENAQAEAERVWLRDQRYRAFQALLTTGYSTITTFGHLAILNNPRKYVNKSDIGIEEGRIISLQEQFAVATSECEMLGALRVVQLARNYSSASHQLFRLHLQFGRDTKNWLKHSEELVRITDQTHDFYERMAVAIRATLKVPEAVDTEGRVRDYPIQEFFSRSSAAGSRSYRANKTKYPAL